MTNQFKTLQSLQEQIVNVDDYYVMTMRENEIIFQGKFTPEIVKSINNRCMDVGVDTMKQKVTDAGYVEIRFKYVGVAVDITLT